MEDLAAYSGVLFALGWFIKIINYSIFDYYETGFGKIGALIMATFMFYKKEELANEKEKHKRVSKLINNICAYTMLTTVLAILLLALFYTYR